MNNDSKADAEIARRSKILDFEKFLPFGETLRVYLEQPFVTKTDLSELLRARGVFVQDAQKEALIPLVAATLISPAEFQTLLDCRRERDSKEKVFERTKAWKSNRSLIEAANSAVNLNALPFTSSERCKLLGKPALLPVDGNSDHVELEFTIQRTKLSMDWSNEESQFTGKVTLKKVEIAGRVIIKISHTSPETKEVAEQYAKLVEESLRSSGDIGEPTPFDQILYSSFSNIERADFLLSLTGGCKHNELEFERLSKLEALTDTSQPIPNNCKKLIEGFEQLQLRGELHKSAYCRDRSIYPFVRFYRMDAHFKFKVVGAEGVCHVRYEFADYGTSQSAKAEFAYEVEVTSLSEKFKRTTSKTAAKKPLQELIGRITAEKFKVFREAKENPVPLTARRRKRPVTDDQQELFPQKRSEK